jgi:hypothetical protein
MYLLIISTQRLTEREGQGSVFEVPHYDPADGESALTRSPRGFEALCLSIRYLKSTTFDVNFCSFASHHCAEALFASSHIEDPLLLAYHQPMRTPSIRGLQFGDFAVSTITHMLPETPSALHVIMDPYQY